MSDEPISRDPKVAAYIERVLAEAPPLTAEQRAKQLYELLRPVRESLQRQAKTSAEGQQ